MNPTIPLPSQPILTRWCTWIETSVYYCQYFQFIKTVINEFKKNDAIATKKVKYLMSDKEIEANVLFIKANYESISNCIIRLKASGILLIETMNILNNPKVYILNNAT